MVKKFPAFMKPKVLSPCSQKHYITPYPEIEGSSLQFQTLLQHTYFNGINLSIYLSMALQPLCTLVAFSVSYSIHSR
jgi:hypothetical protein